MSGFQSRVNTQPAPAVAGDFASSNPRASVVAPEAGFVCGTNGVNVGLFGWVDTDGVTVNNTASSGAPDGFVHREQQALIGTYLQESGNNIPKGFPVTLMRTGDYYVTVTVANATKDQKAFAKLADGTMQPGNAGATISGYVETPFIIAQGASVGELAVISR